MKRKFSLKWNDFGNNAKKAFGLLKNEDFLHDVTLVAEDNKQLAAHKLVLSACSEYFRNIFKNNNHYNILLCLNDITSDEIENILDYMYYGEVNIYQEDLDRFLSVAKRFQIEGLLESTKKEKADADEAFSVAIEESQLGITKRKPTREISTELVNNGPIKVFLEGEELDNLEDTIRQYYEMSGDEGRRIYRCTFCGKDARKKQHIEQHIEGKHLEGLSMPCHICGIAVKSRNALHVHNNKAHKFIPT